MNADAWGHVVDNEGSTTADLLTDRVGALRDEAAGIGAYLDVIADCLVALAEVASPDAGKRRALLQNVRESRS